MGKILKTKGTKDLFIEAGAIALVKNIEERLLTPFVGNGSIKSGIVKAVAGIGIPAVAGNNKISKILSTAFIVDSAEDFVNVGMGMLSGAGIGVPGGSTDNWA